MAIPTSEQLLSSYIEALLNPQVVRRALYMVLAERELQEETWGEQNHDFGEWLKILIEEVGEASQASLQTRYGGPKAGTVRAELVQVAAVALAMLECALRKNW